MFKASKCAVLLLVVISLNSARADQTSVAFDSGSKTVYANSARTIPLSGGSATVDGDGAVLQLGYYNGATAGNNFSGTFILLSGQGSADTAFNTTSIGDTNANGAGNGTFALALDYVAGSPTTGNNLPAAGQILSIRFFNASTVAASTAFNVVSNNSWVWASPSTPASNVQLSLDNTGIVWLGGASTAFYTSQAIVPEPSSYIITLLGCGIVLLVAKQASKPAKA